MTPSGVLLGLFLAVAGLVLGTTISELLQDQQEKNRIRREWKNRTSKEVDIT